ncbi:MAG TPA: hypothetical protein VHD56_08240 [Tepidisphaeraceae bacterium]|nr:hypothetical protein [Tepidisphaeraceae bacterium]
MRATTRFTLLIVLALAGLADAQVTVSQADSVIQRKYFDPNNRPGDMPKLNPRESAVTQSFFGADSRVGGAVVRKKQIGDEWQAWVKVDTVRMTLQMRVTIWLPNNPVPKLVNHEEGHRRIAELYYQDAEPTARELADHLLGQEITGKGANPEAAADNALKEAAETLGQQYMGRIDIPCGKAEDLFDEITIHGTNAIREEEAIKQAINRVANDSVPAGSSP